MKASLVEVGETVMAPPLMEIGWGQGEPGPNPSQPPGGFPPPTALNTPYFHHRGGRVVLLLRKGTACIRLSEFYIGHKVRQLEKFTRRWQEGWEGHWEKTKEQTGVNM